MDQEWIDDEFEENEVESYSDSNDYDRPASNEEVISNILREMGIEDSSKIMYENEYGEEEEIDWNQLPLQDKINILRGSSDEDDNDLSDDEIDLINAIRESQMSPSEYFRYVQRETINNYQQPTPQYEVDSYSDDELFVYDMLTKLGEDVSDEEVLKELEAAKDNPEIYNRKIQAIRGEYKNLENQQIQQMQYQQQMAYQQQYQQFANNLVNSINSFDQIAGADLELEDDDKQEIYDFVTGTDAAGINHFAKALQDTDLVTRMAWFILHGEEMIDEINDYWKKEVARSRRDSRNGRDSFSSKSAYIPKQQNHQQEYFDDFE